MRLPIQLTIFFLAIGFRIPAKAAEIHNDGVAIHISGRLSPGDEDTFRRALDNGTSRVVSLDTGGGNIATAFRIARTIRRSGMSTSVDGSKARCHSACTVLFAAGINRAYFNADGIAEGIATPRAKGLGYHQGRSTLPDGRVLPSETATSKMIYGYREFGSPNAVPLAHMASMNEVYIISGMTALRLGIATSMRNPFGTR